VTRFLLLLLSAPGLLSAQAPSAGPYRTIAIDARLAARSALAVGDLLVLAAESGEPGDTVRVAAITARAADPSEISRSDFRVRVHLDHLQALTGAGDRVGRFAVAEHPNAGARSTVALINDAAFGFRAYDAAEVAVESSATFRVVDRFHRAIGVITIVASAIFLLCITLLKVDERRRDVGALRLIGISRRSVMLSVVVESALVAVIGSAMGAAIGYGASALVNWYYQGFYATPLRFTLVTP